MAKYLVTVELEVEADGEQEAQFGCQYAVENLVAGDIVDARVMSVDEQVLED